MNFELVYTEEADSQLEKIENNPSYSNIKKAVQKTLGLMETNLRHPSLNTHKYSSLEGPNKEDVFESYAQNKTPSEYRVFWYYGPDQGFITILAITPHP